MVDGAKNVSRTPQPAQNKQEDAPHVSLLGSSIVLRLIIQISAYQITAKIYNGVILHKGLLTPSSSPYKALFPMSLRDGWLFFKASQTGNSWMLKPWTFLHANPSIRWFKRFKISLMMNFFPSTKHAHDVSHTSFYNAHAYYFPDF